MSEDFGFLLLYASQTGQAKAIAEDFYQLAVNDGMSPRVHCLSENEKQFCLEKETCAVFIVSTTGEGEPPETALKFWRKLKRTVLPKVHLSQLNFSLLGLGDTNYTNFCNFGKMLNQRLEELGARHFSESSWADDGVGLELVVEPWKEETFSKLKEHLKSKLAGESHDRSDTASSTLASDDQNIHLNSFSIMNGGLENGHGETQKLGNGNITSGLSNGTSYSNKEQNSNEKEISLPSLQTLSLQNTDEVQPNPVEPELLNDASTSVVVAPVIYSLTCSALADVPLTVQLCPPRFLKVSFLQDEIANTDHMREEVIRSFAFPGARSPVSYVPVKSAKRLTCDEAVKTTLQIDLDISSCDWSYEPGDTVAVICPNDANEVNSLIARLGLTHVANNSCHIETLKNTRLKNELLPQTSTLFEVLRTCCEIREPPEKRFIRALVDFTEDPAEKRRLQELCSKQGFDDYAKFIRGPRLCLLDILYAFPSCKPPVEVVLENLRRLQPRPYSASSSLLKTPGSLQFVFNILHFSAGEGRSDSRFGVCTGWLDKVIRHLYSHEQTTTENENNEVNQTVNIPIFLRTNRYFHLPSDLSIPLVMIGPGTGVAPFIGFLQHRSRLVSDKVDSKAVGETWLFYGCRNKNLDFLFKKELEAFVSDGVLTRLHVGYSRDPSRSEDAPRYVQDNMRIFGKELIDLIYDKNAYVFICGDAKGMSPDVHKTFKSLLQLHKDMDESAAEAYMTAMRGEPQRRYLEDVWV